MLEKMHSPNPRTHSTRLVCADPVLGLDTSRPRSYATARFQTLRRSFLSKADNQAPVTRYLFLSILFALVFSLAASAATRKIIFDTDPGTDDAMALMLALNSSELDVRAITVVPGNVTAKQGLENALRMVSLANRCDIPVAAGAQHPLFQKLITAEFWHGKNGLANIELPPSKCKVNSRYGPDLIIELVHAAPHEITLVPVGPLTNIALAAEKDPSIVPLVKQVILMGGSITGGNVNAAAEANIYNDPEAAQIVFQAGWPVTMVGLDVGDKTLLSKRHLEQLAQTHGPVNDFIYQVGFCARYCYLSEDDPDRVDR